MTHYLTLGLLAYIFYIRALMKRKRGKKTDIYIFIRRALNMEIKKESDTLFNRE